MRAWTSVLLVAVAVSVSAGQAQVPTTLERMVPANAVAFVQARDLPSLAAAFEKSAIADVVRASKVLSYFRNVLSAAGQFASVAATGLASEEFRACFGRQIGAVLLDFRDRQDIQQRVPAALLVEVADAEKLQGVISAQLEIFASLGAQIPITQRQHQGVLVHDITPPRAPRGLSFAVHRGVLIVGSPAGVDGILDHCAANAPCVTAADTYLAVRERLGADGILAYVNVRSLVEKSGIAANPAQMARARGLGIANVGGAGLSVDFAGRQVRERLYLQTEGAPTGILRLLTAGKPSVPDLLSYVPRDFTVAGTLALNDVGLWDRLRGLIVDTKGEAAASFLDTAAQKVHEAFAIQIKEGLFDTLTDQVTLAVDLRQIPDFFGSGVEPTPQQIPFLLGAKLRDVGLLEATITRVATNEKLWELGVTRQKRAHGDTEYSVFTIPGQLDLAPSYAVVDGVLLVALRPEIVTQAMDAHAREQGLAVAQAAPAHLAVHASDSAILGILLKNIREDVPPQARRFLPDLDALIGRLSGFTAELTRDAGGVLLEARSDLGTTGTLALAAALGNQGHAVVARRVEGDFEKIAAALEAYRQQHGAYPETLDALVPACLPRLNGDRFAPKRPYGYRHLANAWILTSVGPNKTPDIPIDEFDPIGWAAAQKTQDPAQIARIKRVVYQFRKDEFNDEAKNDDEGDLVRMGGPGLTARPAPPNPQEPAP
jgi:hypothetical protein